MPGLIPMGSIGRPDHRSVPFTTKHPHLGRVQIDLDHSFTMADIPIACEIDRWQALPRERPGLPHLERWYRALLAHPASRGVLQLPPA